MRIGLDIASLALKRLVSTIVLVTGEGTARMPTSLTTIRGRGGW